MSSSHSRSHVWVMILGLAACPMTALGQATTAPSDTDAQIRQLRTQVQQLQQRLDAQSTTRPSQADATISGGNDEANNSQRFPSQNPAVPQQTGAPNEMLGLHAGWDPNRGFIIRSEDNSFLLHPWAFIQFRDATTYRSAASATSGADTENGFELPRAKFILDGNVITRDLTYQMIWATSDTSGNLGLQDCWARYHIPDTEFAVEGGQIRNPLDHEQYLFATKSLTPDRSIVNNVLLNGDDIVKGVEVAYGWDTDSQFRTLGAFTSGQRNFDTDFQQYPTNPADWGVAGRAEWKLFGDWKDYTQFTALGDKTPLLVVGGGADYTEAGAAAALTHVVDVQYDLPEGTGVYAAYLGRYTRDNADLPTTNGAPTTPGAPRFDTYDATARVMVSQLIDNRFEPFIRYEYIQFDPHEIPAGLNSTVNDITLGCNYYFYGHRAKFTFGASYLPNGSPVGNTIMDLLASHRGDEVIVQAQFQLML